MGMYWSYNQGIILGGLGKLYEESGDENYAEVAEKIIISIIDENLRENPWLYEGGILKEHCEPVCDDSAQQFKGVFMRYLNYFMKSCIKKGRKINKIYERFIHSNAKALWKYDRDQFNRFGLVWKGPVNET